MSAFATSSSPPFSVDLADGLAAERKQIDPRYLFDEIGVALFETVAMLPEYGLARAEERILRRCSSDFRKLIGPLSSVNELGRGNKQAALHLLCSFGIARPQCREQESFELSMSTADWLKSASRLLTERRRGEPMLLTLLAGSAGNVDRGSFFKFLKELRTLLVPGDYFLFGVDLVKDIDKMIASYRDPAGVISAFNKNLLSRINRELGGRFNLDTFDHKVSWNTLARCIELQLRSRIAQTVYIGALGSRFPFRVGETICTLRDFKYSEMELELLANEAGFRIIKTRTDLEWAFADVLWTV